MHAWSEKSFAWLDCSHNGLATHGEWMGEAFNGNKDEWLESKDELENTYYYRPSPPDLHTTYVRGDRSEITMDKALAQNVWLTFKSEVSGGLKPEAQ